MPTPTGLPRALYLLVALAMGLTLALAWPFAGPLFLAAVLAGSLSSSEAWLAGRLRGRRGAAALVLTLAVLFAVVVPFGGLAAFLVREAVQLANIISGIVRGGGTEALTERLPHWLQPSAQRLFDDLVRVTGTSLGGLESLGERAAKALPALGGVFAATGTAVGFLLRLLLMLIALYFLLVDGGRLISWFESISPLRPGQVRELLGEFRRVSVVVLRSTLLTALVQAATATVGFFIARAPQPVFFGLVTFFFALVPALGGALGCLSVALLLLATGHTAAAVFLAIWALLVVGLVDNVVKPLFIRGGVDLPGVVIFFSLLGGLAVFGPVGLLAGPLIVSFLLAVLRIRDRERDLALTTRPLDAAVGLAAPRRPPEAPRLHA